MCLFKVNPLNQLSLRCVLVVMTSTLPHPPHSFTYVRTRYNDRTQSHCRRTPGHSLEYRALYVECICSSVHASRKSSCVPHEQLWNSGHACFTSSVLVSFNLVFVMCVMECFAESAKYVCRRHHFASHGELARV